MLKNVEEAIKALKEGQLIIVVDDDDREAEGDLVGLAQFASQETVNFMTKFARGLICAPVSREVAQRLNLSPMTQTNMDPHGTAFTISVDHRESTTGISAAERAKTIRELANPDSQPEDFLSPGHLFPLVGREGGVLKRRGHTEASLDLARLSGAYEATYICEILNDDGSMARKQQLYLLAEEWQMPIIEVGDLARYMAFQDSVSVHLPSQYGDFQMTLFEDEEEKEHVVISKGDLENEESLLVRLHSECLTGDIFGSNRCDCGEQLEESLRQIEARGRGAILYLRQEGRGIGLKNKLKAYQLQEQGQDTYDANLSLGFEADARDYKIAADILNYLKVSQIDLLTNNPDKLSQLEDLGISVKQRIPLIMPEKPENHRYFQTKIEKFHHLLKG